MWRSLAISAAAIVPLFPAFFGYASSADSNGCRFVLGFAALETLIPMQVGTCLDDEAHNPVNGDTLQRTSGGLLVWRKADNRTAFTDGYHTWVNGPEGLRERLNSQRFPWEANPDGLPLVGAPSGHGCGSTAANGKVQTQCPPP